MTALSALLSIVLTVAATGWSPASFANQGTVEFLTVAPDEGEHWSTVWFVVIDDAVYLRLGPRAAKRIEQNSTAPRLKLRVGPDEVHSVRYEKAPEMADRIADAMYEKYWTDFLGEPFRKLGLSSTPVMLRLVADDAAAPNALP
ncbi:MAG: hypothetical protein ACREKH_21945 [Candidatus Rokuibacteriota bacterium]